MKKGSEPLFSYYVISRHMSEQVGFTYTKNDFEKELEKYQGVELSIIQEKLLKDYDTCEENAYTLKALEILIDNLEVA